MREGVTLGGLVIWSLEFTHTSCLEMKICLLAPSGCVKKFPSNEFLSTYPTLTLTSNYVLQKSSIIFDFQNLKESSWTMIGENRQLVTNETVEFEK